MPLTALSVLLLCVALTSSPAIAEDADAPLFSADGYRIDKFRAPVPDSVDGAATLTTVRLQSLLKQPGVVLLDVLPAPVKPKNRPANLLWLPPDRYDIPGSHWLPNVGYGALSNELERYFKNNLASLTGGDKAKPIVVYCLADCWMSWNAARRAATEYGYTRVYWYPDGTNGWEAAGMSLEKRVPVERDAP